MHRCYYSILPAAFWTYCPNLRVLVIDLAASVVELAADPNKAMANLTKVVHVGSIDVGWCRNVLLD